MDFEEYLKLPYYSHSFLKAERNGMTDEFLGSYKVKIGSMVDAILCETGKINMLDEHYPIAKSIAFEIKKVFGSYIAKFQKQVSYTTDLVYEYHSMPAKVRLDFLLPGHASIDLKVTHEKDVHALIKYMGYQNQLWHQCKCSGVKKQYIMIHSVPLRKTFMIDLGVVTERNEFWENKILKFGQPIAA